MSFTSADKWTWGQQSLVTLGNIIFVNVRKIELNELMWNETTYKEMRFGIWMLREWHLEPGNLGKIRKIKSVLSTTDASLPAQTFKFGTAGKVTHCSSHMSLFDDMKTINVLSKIHFEKWTVISWWQETEVTSTPTRPVDNVVITTKGLQDRNINILDGTTVQNQGKLILTEIFPSVQKHDMF